MTEEEKLVVTAGNLMGMSLACLQQTGEREASKHLRLAIESLNGVRKAEPNAENRGQLSRGINSG
jgi:hypothetical protein